MTNQAIKRQLSLTLLSCLLLLGCGGEAPSQESPADEVPAPDQVREEEETPEAPIGTPVAVVDTVKGRFEIELLPDLAPLAVENFVGLVDQGFYRRTTFHRVIPSQLIQGGDPNSRDRDLFNDGQGNSGSYVKAEFSDKPFVKGTVAMARRPGDPHSASCQFFVTLKRMPSWDGEYTIFGRVIEGIEVVEEISKSPTIKGDPRLRQRPARSMAIKSVLIEYR